MTFQYPWGNLQGLNLTWFINQFKKLREDWATAEAGIDGALDAEIQKAEDALSDVFDARDAAAASETAAGNSASAAALSATAAQNSASAAASSATLANNKATAAGLSEAAAAQSASQAALSASNAGNAATRAGNSATAAGNSATAAGNSATAAAGSASAAAISETNAAASAQRAEDAAASSQAGAVVKSVENVPIASVDDALDEKAVQLVVGIEPVQAGTGDPSPDNVRPITGWTGAKIEKAGKNLVDLNGWLDDLGISYTMRDGYTSFTPTSAAYSNFIPLPAGIKTVQFESGSGTLANNLRLRLKYSDGTINNNVYAPVTGDIVGIAFNWSSTDVIEVKLQAEFSSTASDYEPYQGATIPITFPAAAGTVYGGTLINAGTETWKLRITHRFLTKNTANMNNSENYPGWKNSGIRDIIGSGINGSVLGSLTNISAITNPNLVAANTTGDTGDLLMLNKSVIDKTQTEWIALAMDIQFVVPLATPIEYTITGDAVEMLLGINNIWADTGGINLLRYYADSKGYIDAQDALVKALIAKELDEMKADTALTANDLRIINNTLYRITAPIASGATLTPGTNCEATTVAAILKTLLT